MSHISTFCNSGSAKHMLRRALLGTAASCIAASAAAPAFAQDQDDAFLENILVIARKKAESLQDVPISIQAIGAATIDTYQFNEIADVATRIPGLNVQVGGSGAGGQISLRGVGSSNISAAFDSAVAFDFDGVQVSTMRLVQAAFFDVEQIEVLKGPQSLYFGKSATAGVFSLRSANPTDEWMINGKASYEFEEEGYTVEGVVSGPLTDTLGIRVAAQYQDIEEFLEYEAGTPTIRDSAGVRNFVGRITLQYDPTDNFSANLKVNYNHNDSDTLLGHSDIGCGANGIADPISLFGGGVTIASNSTCDIDDGLYPTGDGHPTLQLGPDGSNGIPTGTTGADRYTGQAYNETKTFFARLTMDLDITDNLTISSVTGYLDLENEYLDHFGYVGILDNGDPGGLSAPFANGLEQFTQELRLASSFDGPLNFMVGAFYESRDIPLETSQNAIVFGLLLPDPNTGFRYDWFSSRPTTTDAYSVFGSFTYELTERLEITAGARWTHEDKSARNDFPYVHQNISDLGIFLSSGFASNPINFSDSNVSPEVTISYEATDDINVYAAFKTGYKSGGIDNSALPSATLADLLSDDPDEVAAAEAGLIYDSETAVGGEIGVKTQFSNIGLTINAAAFYYVFDNLQVQNFDPIAIQFQTSNASQLTSYGLDLDWSWRTSIDGLSFSGTALIGDTSYTDTFLVDVSGGVEDLDGRVAPRAPTVSGNIAVDYTKDVGSSLVAGFAGNLFYSGSYLTNEDTLNDDIRQDSYVSIDAGLFIGDTDGRWRLSLTATNLTDEIWNNTTGGRPFLPDDGDDIVYTQNRGRQVFMTAQFSY